MEAFSGRFGGVVLWKVGWRRSLEGWVESFPGRFGEVVLWKVGWSRFLEGLVNWFAGSPGRFTHFQEKHVILVTQHHGVCRFTFGIFLFVSLSPR